MKQLYQFYLVINVSDIIFLHISTTIVFSQVGDGLKVVMSAIMKEVGVSVVTEWVQ